MEDPVPVSSAPYVTANPCFSGHCAHPTEKLNQDVQAWVIEHHGEYFKKQFMSKTPPEAAATYMCSLMCNTLRHFDTKFRGFFQAPSQVRVLELLWNLVGLLSRGNFCNKPGNACKTLLGQQGIGKTWALRYFVETIGYYYRKTHAVYVGLEDVRNCSRILPSMLIQQATGRDVKDDGVRTVIAQCIEDLVTYDEKIVIIVDEFELLYKITLDPNDIGTAGEDDSIKLVTHEELRCRKLVLQELLALANSAAGVVSVVLCGSSSSLHRLVKATTGDPILSTSFPLLRKGVPDMNGSKFEKRRITCGEMGITDIQRIWSVLLDTPIRNETWCKCAVVLAGHNLRNIDQTMTSIFFLDSQQSRNVAEDYTGFKDDFTRDVVRAIYTLMFDSLPDDSPKDMFTKEEPTSYEDLVNAYDHRESCYLSNDDVLAIIKEYVQKHEKNLSDRYKDSGSVNPQVILESLIDRRYIMSNSTLSIIYPVTIAMVYGKAAQTGRPGSGGKINAKLAGQYFRCDSIVFIVIISCIGVKEFMRSAVKGTRGKVIVNGGVFSVEVEKDFESG